jgi:hypothetical protein
MLLFTRATPRPDEAGIDMWISARGLAFKSTINAERKATVTMI